MYAGTNHDVFSLILDDGRCLHTFLEYIDTLFITRQVIIAQAVDSYGIAPVKMLRKSRCLGFMSAVDH